MTFKGFCNEHDTSLFKEIEMIDTDFSIYKNQLILTYKAISNEFRKKEVLLDWYGEINNLNNQEIEQLEKKIANSGKIYKEDEYDLELCYNKKIHFEEFIKNTNISLKTDLMFYLNELDYELKEQSNRYLFFYKKYLILKW